MELEVYQFISRRNIANESFGGVNTSPKERPDLNFSIDFEVIDKPFEINFTQVVPSRPSIGAYEYIDPYVDVYMKERWPKCIRGRAKLVVPDIDKTNNSLIHIVG